MNYRNQWLLPSLVLCMLSLPTMASGDTLYVATTGDDDGGNGTCTALSPCKTISYAMSKITTDGTAGSPHVINIAAGTYVAGAVFTGEIYPINVVKDYVSLVGAGSGSTEIVGAGTGYIFSVTSTGLSVQDLKFSSAGTAVHINGGQGGHSFSNNIVESSVGTGVYCSLWNLNDDSDFTVFPHSFTGNTFNSTDYGVDFKIGLTFDGTTTGLTAAVGNITATGNTFNCDSDGFIIDEVYIRSMASGTASVGTINASNNTFNNCSVGLEIDNLYFEDMEDSTGTWGNVTVDGNTFIKNSDAVKFYGYFGSSGNDMVNTSVTMGNVAVSNNTLTDNSGTAMDLDWFDVSYLSGSSMVTLGNLTVHNNTIEPDTLPVSGEGIKIDDIGYMEYLYDTTKVTTGTVAVTDNTVKIEDDALYLYNYGNWYMGVDDGSDTVEVTFGPMNITGNDLSATSGYGAYLGVDYFGYDVYAQTKTNVGLITVDNNTVKSVNSEALYFDYQMNCGEYMYDNSQITLTGLVFTNNTITSTNNYGVYMFMYYIGYDMNDSATLTLGPTTFTGNTITSYYEAAYLIFEGAAYDMYNSAILTMDPWTVSNNTLTATGSADYAALTIYYEDLTMGHNMQDNSTATLPNWIISNNTMDVKGDHNGIYFYTYSNPDDLYNEAMMNFGSIFIDNNTLNANKDGGMSRGIDFWIEDTCEECFDSSSFTHGDITVTNNTIYSVEDIGINLDYDDVGYDFDDAGKNTMGDILIGDNMIDTAPTGIQVRYRWPYSDIVGTSAVEIGTLDISGNTIGNITGDAVTFSVEAHFGNPPDHILDPTASLTIGQATISGNTVIASSTPDGKSAGVWLNGDIHPDVTFAAPEVNDNSVSGFSVGLGFDDLPQASMRCNTAENNSEAGLFFITDGDFTAQYNSLLDNGLGVRIGTGDHATLMAEKNWWGDAAGPVACADCNKIDAGGGTVDFDPWLASATMPECGDYVFPWPAFIPAITGAGSR